MDSKVNFFSESIIDEVGNTPLIKLKKASEITQCNILGKAEFLNPGQSVKDRAALHIINELKLEKIITVKLLLKEQEVIQE